MILVASHKEDAQGSLVCRRLDELGCDYMRTDLALFAENALYSIEPLKERFSQGEIFSNFRKGFEEKVGGGASFHAIYWRRPYRMEDWMKSSRPSSGEVAYAEAYQAFRLAVESLPDSFFPLGHPAHMDRAENKLLQLRLAKEVGFNVPETLVGNDPQVIACFLNRHANMVVKPIRINSVYKEDDRSQVERPLWCTGIDPEQIKKVLRLDRRAQLMLQQQIIKKEDWRVTILPHKTISCKIDTSALSASEPDWRKGCKNHEHTLFDLPTDIERRLREYLKRLSLTAGYFDFAVDVSGKPYFLEVNTNGEWLWIEELTGYPISEEVAKCFKEWGAQS